MVLLEKSAVFEEGFSEVWTTSDAAGGFAGLLTNRVEVFADELGHVGTGQVAPEVFNRVQFRCVGRQVFDGQPMLLSRDPLLDFCSTSQSPFHARGISSSNTLVTRFCEIQ